MLYDIWVPNILCLECLCRNFRVFVYTILNDEISYVVLLKKKLPRYFVLQQTICYIETYIYVQYSE